MERIGGEDVRQRTSARKAALASFVGAVMDWYDFFLYGIAAALVFNQLFFPSLESAAGTLASFATFGVALTPYARGA